MFDIITDIISFLKSLELIDYVLFFSVMALIVLIVSLLYIVRTSDEEYTYTLDKDLDDDLDLVALSKEIDEHTPYNNIDLTDYETEQEEKAIISYDELIKQHKNYALNYEEESNKAGINIKKIDNSNPLNETDIEDKSTKVPNIVLSYEREEEFLKLLKQLNSLLN